MEGEDAVMYKISRVFFLGVFLSISLTACSSAGSQNLSGSPASQGNANASETQGVSGSEESQEEQGKRDKQAQEPLLGADATDEELLELLGDEVNLVTDGSYIELISDFKKHTENYSGKIYQIEGAYHMEDGIPYITRTIVDGDEKSVQGMPLKYLPSEPQEGDWIQVTGVINEGEIGGETMALLEVVILKPLKEQGQAELSAS